MILCQRLPCVKGGLVLVPLERGFVTNAWLTDQYTARLCATDTIRAMPETEIPPAMQVDFYFIKYLDLFLMPCFSYKI